MTLEDIRGILPCLPPFDLFPLAVVTRTTSASASPPARTISSTSSERWILFPRGMSSGCVMCHFARI